MITVERCALALVVDSGRRGHMHEGVPWSGPMVPELHTRANRAVQNPEGAAAIEIYGSIEISATVAITVANERGEVTVLAKGDRLALASDPKLRVRYLAVAGGIDVPIALGSRTTLHGTMGGLERGLALSRGSEIRCGANALETAAPSADRAEDQAFDGSPIALVGGPDDDLFTSGALTLTQHEYEILPTSNRIGTRLRGPSLVARSIERDRPSMPMMLGALQIPPNGMPIVLGPDHPTTGGYPVVAVISSQHVGKFHAMPIGSRVRFALS